MRKITITRPIYERLKEHSPSNGVVWELSEGMGIVTFRKDGTVTLKVKDDTWNRLNGLAPNDPERALSMLLDKFDGK